MVLHEDDYGFDYVPVKMGVIGWDLYGASGSPSSEDALRPPVSMWDCENVELSDCGIARL